MKSMIEGEVDRETRFASLAALPVYLAQSFSKLTPEEACAPRTDGTFSPVEHVWHLADVERDGFGERIRRLLSEDDPWLPDFDGTRIAREREYRSLTLGEGLAAFAAARAHNLSILRAASEEAWARRGVQEGVGAISLCDLPRSMATHDAAHREEIEAWLRARGS
jgi:hypothetical protein